MSETRQKRMLGVGIWVFKAEKGIWAGDGKTNGTQTFAGPDSAAETHSGLWAPGPAKFTHHIEPECLAYISSGSSILAADPLSKFF